MTCRVIGKIGWGEETSEDWNRNYKLRWLIETDTPLDGPFRALYCPGLPAVGTQWIFGNDNDPYAFCWPNWTVSQFTTGNPNEPNFYFVVEQPYSTKSSMSSSQNQTTNPLALPPNVSGTFVKYTEEAQYDRNGKPIVSSSRERIRGKVVEFDANRPTVSIEQNYASLGLNVFAPLIDNVNDGGMWGLQKRMVKLSNIRWTRNLYAFGFYYTRAYDFDVNFKTFDRKVPDCGTKRLLAGGTKTNSTHWSQAKDKEGNIIRDLIYYKADGTEETDPISNAPNQLSVEKYSETDLFVLGIPSSF